MVGRRGFFTQAVTGLLGSKAAVVVATQPATPNDPMVAAARTGLVQSAQGAYASLATRLVEYNNKIMELLNRYALRDSFKTKGSFFSQIDETTGTTSAQLDAIYTYIQTAVTATQKAVDEYNKLFPGAPLTGAELCEKNAFATTNIKSPDYPNKPHMTMALIEASNEPVTEKQLQNIVSKATHADMLARTHIIDTIGHSMVKLCETMIIPDRYNCNTTNIAAVKHTYDKIADKFVHVNWKPPFTVASLEELKDFAKTVIATIDQELEREIANHRPPRYDTYVPLAPASKSPSNDSSAPANSLTAQQTIAALRTLVVLLESLPDVKEEAPASEVRIAQATPLALEHNQAPAARDILGPSTEDLLARREESMPVQATSISGK